ncbi:MAG: hypothetical protein A2V90_01805 [Gammaproteobacteria bacterium RBG_16_57_12]|nr:MAG: hypothetical protein A2V90_01805 [Gammaproteobacteria bacterium RBG_16_57_12]
MSQRLQHTQDMLARHHRNGEQFAQYMKDSFAGRFNEDFWTAWQQWIEPVLGRSPVILDLGTGPALFLRALQQRYAGVRAIGVECMPYMIAAAGALPEGCEIIEADLHDPRLPLADGSVDAALAAVVLHELNQPLRALQEVARCLRRGGRLCLFDWVRAPLAQYLTGEEVDVFAPSQTVESLEDIFTHFIEHNRFTRQDLEYLLTHSGFRVLDSQPLREGQFARIFAERL